MPEYISKNSETVIKQVFKRFVGLMKKKEFVNGTVEIINAHLTLDPAEPKLSYGSIRPFNEKYSANEEAWYDSQDLCIKGHPGIEGNKTWESCATADGYVNSNYGYLVYSPRSPGMSQFHYAVQNLKPVKGNSGRQSIIYYAGPEMAVWNNDGIHANHDWTCTISTQHFIRKNKLYYIVTQRSCDSIFGLTFDFVHHCKTYMNLLKELKSQGYDRLQVGKIYMNFGSLHCYERHYDLVKKIVEAYENFELM